MHVCMYVHIHIHTHTHANIHVHASQLEEMRSLESELLQVKRELDEMDRIDNSFSTAPLEDLYPTSLE